MLVTVLVHDSVPTSRCKACVEFIIGPSEISCVKCTSLTPADISNVITLIDERLSKSLYCSFYIYYVDKQSEVSEKAC